MDNKTQQEAVEHGLNAQLAKGNLPQVSSTIAAMQKAGIKVVDLQIKGQPPVIRSIVTAHVPVEKVGAMQTLFTDRSFKEILVLKRGIPPMPFFYDLQLTLENQ